MSSPDFRQRLLNRDPLLGSWIQVGHPSSAEVLATCGYDWLAIDAEHTDITLSDAANLIRTVRDRVPAILVRVRENDTLAIRQMLDCGAAGVIVPLVNTADEAARAVAACRYPPEGVRGYAFTSANDWGVGFSDYVATANARMACVCMIESRAAVEAIDEILAVPGMDGVFIGPYDLSGSYGLPGQTGHDTVLQACQRVVEACRRHGKSAGLHLVRPTDAGIRKTLDDGFTFIALGMDTVYIRQGAAHDLDLARTILQTEAKV